MYIYRPHPTRHPLPIPKGAIGVRKLCSETATGLSQREYLHSEYSRDGTAGTRGGESVGGGWHFLPYILIIPASVTPTIPRALKGPLGRCCTS